MHDVLHSGKHVDEYCQECMDDLDHHLIRSDVDKSPWDGYGAMGRCAASSNPMAAYDAICAGKRSGDPKSQDAWALPHHTIAGGPPNEKGVADALAYLEKAKDLTNTNAARRHLKAHQAAIEAAKNESETHADSDGDDDMTSPTHGVFTGTHTHKHQDGQGNEGMHSHQHSHDGDGEHNHQHSGESKSVGVPCAPRARDNLFRAVYPGIEVRQRTDGLIGNGATNDAGEAPPMELTGHFAVFDQWTKIDSIFEGTFMESISPGAFKKTLRENKSNIRCLFQHGRDTQIGDKPLGPVAELQEDDVGAHYVVPLLDTSYNRDLIPGLQQGLYGASFRFRVTREDVNESPGKSSRNPDGIPERTIRELELKEFGPVTFPAYGGASAGVRSITDEIVFTDYMRDPERLRELIRTTVGSVDYNINTASSTTNQVASELLYHQPDTKTDTRDSDPKSDEPEPASDLVVVRNPNKKRKYA